ncbi:Pentatricopeptide repeat-containing protein [Corchorus olitorius]|uniref:Pentatricopeptide repeat-containing protein n=1 Tax=Corchorus olitorius TaxID=93759 RepID=A0A1R3KS49_9ROSI|nr:Pentatricopeptide repeat-containing protein [Corchorus olitorius]
MATVFPTRPPETPYPGTLEPRISTVSLLLYRRGTPSANPQSTIKTLLRPNLHPPSTKTTSKTFKPTNLIRKHLNSNSTTDTQNYGT